MPTSSQLEELAEAAWSGREIVDSITGRSGVFLFAYSPAQRSLVSWTGNAQRVLGVKDVAIARDGNLFLRHVHPDDRFLLLTDLEQALKGNGTYRATYRWIRPDNDEVRWLHCRASLAERNGIPLFEGMMIDLSEEFTGSVGTFAGADCIGTVLAAFPTMVFTLSSDLRLLRVNRPGETRFNFGDPSFRHEYFRIGRPLLDCFVDQEQREQCQKVLRSMSEGMLPHHRARITSGDILYNLELVPLREGSAVTGILGIVSDLTEVVRLERQLAELQKLEGLRLLAAGISHHFNNALQGIIGHAAAMRSHPERVDLVSEASQEIVEIVSRVSELTREMLNFDAGSEAHPAAVDLNLAAMAAVNRVEDLFTTGVKVSVMFSNVPPVRALQHHLVEAIEVFLRNARDSLQPGGALALRSSRVRLKEYEIEDLPAGEYARLVISDTGHGMTPEVLKRCRDLFFTTKERDPVSGLGLHGQGLSLSKAHAIIRQFRGGIVIESIQGSGTTISIVLPLFDPPEATVPADPARATPPEVLIVDDDHLVLSTVSALLEEAGYPCICAEDSTRALNFARAHTASLRLVLLDAVMPGMDGPTVLKHLKRLAPDLRVIGFTGASATQLRALEEAGAERVLRKPIDPAVLRSVVAATLAETPKAMLTK